MNLELSNYNIKMNLLNKNINLKDQILLKRINNTFFLTKKLIMFIVKDKSLEFKINKKIGCTNPLLWEVGHILFFWQDLIFKNLNIDFNFTNRDIYNSFLINWEDRFSVKLIGIIKIIELFEEVILKINNYISGVYNLNSFEKYLLYLGNLHQEMHNESLIFTYQLLNVKVFDYTPVYDDYILKDTEFINVPKGKFIQGTDKNFYFDNEYPPFYNDIDSFNISKYCITNYQYLEFVKFDGYNKPEYWSGEGIRWLRRKKIIYPIYWIKTDDGIWMEKVFGKYVKLRYNNPVINISY